MAAWERRGPGRDGLDVAIAVSAWFPADLLEGRTLLGWGLRSSWSCALARDVASPSVRPLCPRLVGCQAMSTVNHPCAPPCPSKELFGCCGHCGCCRASLGPPASPAYPWDSSGDSVPWHGPMPALTKILSLLVQSYWGLFWAPAGEGHGACGLGQKELQGEGQLQPWPGQGTEE